MWLLAQEHSIKLVSSANKTRFALGYLMEDYLWAYRQTAVSADSVSVVGHSPKKNLEN
jgi:hypothetical protein